MLRRTAVRIAATLLAAFIGAVLLSGSDQPVTAHAYPHWQEVASPPLLPRTHALGVPVGERVLVLGGARPGAPALRNGAAYDLRTGIWHHLRTPVGLTDRDTSAVAAGVVVVRHVRPGRPAAWWRYDVRQDSWSRLGDVPRGAFAPFAFGSEVYALSGRHVVVYSVQLRKWTPLRADPLRPLLRHRRVSASRAGTVISGYSAAHPDRLLEDRWDGLRWRRTPATTDRPVRAASGGTTRVRVGGRTLVVRGDRAWIRLP